MQLSTQVTWGLTLLLHRHSILYLNASCIDTDGTRYFARESKTADGTSPVVDIVDLLEYIISSACCMNFNVSKWPEKKGTEKQMTFSGVQIKRKGFQRFSFYISQ